MKNTHQPHGPCNGCAFHLQDCILGVRSHATAPPAHREQPCMEFVPLCLNCQYPAVFCATCSIRRYSDLKPLSRDILPLSEHTYACTW